MLPQHLRLTHAADFSTAVRRGARASSRHLVLHALAIEEQSDLRVGFVVSKAVGNAVRRNEVKRRLRHLMATRLEGLAPGLVVVRALPASCGASSAELGRSLDRCLSRVIE